MAKLVLTTIANLENETTAVAAINNNSTATAAALENTLSRDGTGPNTMGAPLDMNSQRIINLPAPIGNNDAARLADVGTAASSGAAAAASAVAAASSASSAATSAATASSQASAASTSASSASTSAAVAAASNGFVYNWSTNTASSDPGTGIVKGNNATISSITSLFISETDGNGNALAALISDWGASTSANKAVIRLAKASSPGTVWAEFYVTATVTDNGAWDTLTVTFKAGTGVFANTDSLLVKASLVGDKGTAGAGTVAGLTNHGVVIATSATGVGNTIVLTDGQLVVGATGADPTGKTLSGDATLAATGAITLANGAGTRTNLGLGTAATLASSAVVQTANNLADVTAATARTNLGLAIGTNVQAFDAQLSSIISIQSKSANYTTVLTDGGKCIFHPNTDTTARVFTIDSNANVAYPIGTVLTFINDTSAPGTITIALTSDTLVFAPAGTTGSRTLAVCGVATAIKVNATRWIISGTGLT